jgi:membrane-bound serine protease (ClpP class)
VGKLRASVLMVGLVAAWGVSLAWTSSAGAATGGSTVLSLKLNGVVDPFMASYVSRGIDTANRDRDAAVLLTIDTPGGLDSSMRHIVQSILGSKVPVICWTGPSGARAASAGTFIMLACPVNAMAPGTEIGAAHPVGVSGAIENEKVTNDAAAFIQSLAVRWGRNGPWAVSAVRQATSASAGDALKLHVVDLVEPSTSSLLFTVGVCHSGAQSTPPDTGYLRSHPPLSSICPGNDVVPFHMSLSESLFHGFADPNVAFLLVNIGFIALIIWVFHPGFHVSLGVGIVCMAIGLAILETLPVRLVGFVLLGVAAVLFVLDVKAKAHGVLTTGGIAVLILGGLLLFNPSVPTAHVSVPLIVGVAVAAGAFTFFSLRALMLARGTPVRTGLEALEASTGVAIGALTPTGTVRARGETWTAESLAGPVAAGQTVRIVKVKGVKLLVEPLDQGPETPKADTAASAAGRVREGEST